MSDSVTTTFVSESETRLTADALYAQHVDDVARWVTFLVGSGPEREDLVHDVFAIAIRQWPNFRGDARPSTWLYRITRNVVRNHRRRRKVRRWFTLSNDDELPSLAPNADETMIAEHRRASVHRAMSQISDRHRELLVLAEWEGLSGQQIADTLGMRVGAVWTALHRARKAFAKKLDELEGASLE